MQNTSSAERFTRKVLDAYSEIENPRTRQLIQILISHLHSYVNKTKLSEQEWEYTWCFLARMAQFTNEERNEFLLLADVLGISQLVEIINHERPENAVGYALIGPYYRSNAPLRKQGECINVFSTHQKKVKISGRVYDLINNTPIANATIDVWQAASNGLYEKQDPNQPEMNLRGKFKTDKNGNFELVALMPTAYPVPTDGPTGELLKNAKRQPYRPAHIHFIISAADYDTLITQVFIKGDNLVNSDPVFTANESMSGEFIEEGGDYRLNYNFQLKKGKSILPKAPMH